MQSIFEEAFKFAFKDRSWVVKILIGAVIGLIPIVNVIFLVGYALFILRDSVDNKPAALPEWSGWMEIGKAGLNALPAVIVYVILPAVILGFLSAIPGIGKLCMVLAYLSPLITVPLFYVSLIRWHKEGNWMASFKFKEVWATFAKDKNNYLLAALLLVVVPGVLMSLFMRISGYGIFGLQSPVILFPGAFIQFALCAVGFWLSVVSARVYGQIYIGVAK